MHRFGARVDIVGKPFDAVIIVREARQRRFFYDEERRPWRGASPARRAGWHPSSTFSGTRRRSGAGVSGREENEAPSAVSSISTAHTTEENVSAAP